MILAARDHFEGSFSHFHQGLNYKNIYSRNLFRTEPVL
jgi:hypothetical protein